MRSLYELDKEIAVLMGADPNNISNSYTASKELLTAIGGDPSKDLDTNAVYKAISGGAINGAFSQRLTVPDSVCFGFSTFTEFPSDINVNKDRTDFSNLFYINQYLVTGPKINTSNATTMEYMFYYCSNLETVPVYDTKNVVKFSYMFYNCTNLTSVTINITNKATNAGSMFGRCGKLKTINGVQDLTNINNFNSMFNGCMMLQDIILTGELNATINFGDFYSGYTQLSYDSVKSILTAGTNKTSTSSTYITFRKLIMADQNGELAALVAGCNAKNITVNGLTLQ